MRFNHEDHQAPWQTGASQPGLRVTTPEVQAKGLAFSSSFSLADSCRVISAGRQPRPGLGPTENAGPAGGVTE